MWRSMMAVSGMFMLISLGLFCLRSLVLALCSRRMINLVMLIAILLAVLLNRLGLAIGLMRLI